MANTDQELVILNDHINALTDKFHKGLELLCAKYCNDAGHSHICKFWLAKGASAYVSSCLSYRRLAATLTSTMRSTARIIHQSETLQTFSQLYSTASYPHVPLCTVYMGYHCEGYVVNAFEVACTRPSMSIVMPEILESSNFATEFAQPVTIHSADLSIVVLPHSSTANSPVVFTSTCFCSTSNITLELHDAATIDAPVLHSTVVADQHYINVAVLCPQDNTSGLLVFCQANVFYKKLLNAFYKNPRITRHDISRLVYSTHTDHAAHMLSESNIYYIANQWKVFDPGIVA